MSLFERIAPWAMDHRATLLFGLTWITITAVVSIYVASAVGHAGVPTGRKVQRSLTNVILTCCQPGTPGAFAALTLLAVFLPSYIATILVWEDFAYYDDSMLTLSTLKGHNFAPAIWPEDGRFFPLGLQEFNLIRHFTSTAAGYHLLAIAQLLVLCVILLILDDELSITARAALVIVALLTPSILISFSGFTFQERDVLFFLACLVLSVKSFEQTKFIAWAVAVVVCAQIMMYCKETVFLMILTFAASRLILRFKDEHFARSGCGFWTRESRLDLCLATLAVLFLVLYFGFVGNANMHYAAFARLPRVDIVLGYTRVDLLPWLLTAVVLGRSYMILWHRVAPSLLWDALGLSGVACFSAYLSLSIFGIYYLAPVDLIAILYVGRFAALSVQRLYSWVKMAALLLAAIVLFQDVLVSAFSVFERKNFIHATGKVASVVETQYWRRSTEVDLRLFFPFATGEEIMEFGAYLNYQGIPVEGTADETPGLRSVVFSRKHSSGNGPCVEWRSIICRRASEPAPGDLVIVLPDDRVSLAEASVYRERGGVLLSYEPRPHIPQWLYWLFNNLHVGTESRYRYDRLPDRWMDASVVTWK
jgi:hypothetical protein